MGNKIENSHNERLVKAETQLEFVIDRLDEVNNNLHKLTQVVQDSTSQMMNVVNNTLHQTQEFYRLTKDEFAEYKINQKEKYNELQGKVDILEGKADKFNGALWILGIIWTGAIAIISLILKTKG